MAIPEKKTSTTQRIEQSLRTAIASGEWGEGERLPGRATLAKHFDVSVNTLQRAIRPLIDEGILDVKDRSTTTVRSRHSTPQSDESHPLSSTNSLKGKCIAMVAWESMANVTQNPNSSLWTWNILQHTEALLKERGADMRFYNVDEYNSAGFRHPGPALEAAKHMTNDALVMLNVIDTPGWESHYIDATESIYAESRSLYVAGWQSHLPTTHIAYEQQPLGYAAGAHLRRCRCTDIAYLSHLNAPWSHQRWAGIQASVGENINTQLLVDMDQLPTDNKDSEAGRQIALTAMKTWAKQHPQDDRIRAIVCSNDELALEVLAYVKAEKLTIGVMGFDDSPQAMQACLTTLAFPARAYAEAIVRHLEDDFAGKDLPAKTVLQWQLMHRGSTLCRPQQHA